MYEGGAITEQMIEVILFFSAQILLILFAILSGLCSQECLG